MSWINNVFSSVAAKVGLPETVPVERVVINGQPVLVSEGKIEVTPETISGHKSLFVLQNFKEDKNTTRFPQHGRIYDLEANILISATGEESMFWWEKYVHLIHGRIEGVGFSSASISFNKTESDTPSLIGIYFPKYTDQLTRFGQNFKLVSIGFSVKVYGCKQLSK